MSGNQNEEQTSFLNVDLDLTGPENLSQLVESLRNGVFALHISEKAPYITRLEVAPEQPDVETTISAFLDLIENLDSKSKKIWDACTQRTFNIGIQAGREPHWSEFSVSNELVKRVAKVGAAISISVYGSRIQDSLATDGN